MRVCSNEIAADIPSQRFTQPWKLGSCPYVNFTVLCCCFVVLRVSLCRNCFVLVHAYESVALRTAFHQPCNIMQRSVLIAPLLCFSYSRYASCPRMQVHPTAGATVLSPNSSIVLMSFESSAATLPRSRTPSPPDAASSSVSLLNAVLLCIQRWITVLPGCHSLLR